MTYSLAGTNNRIVWGGDATYLTICVSGSISCDVTGNIRLGIMKNGANASLYEVFPLIMTTVSPFTITSVLSVTTGDFFKIRSIST